MEDGKTNETDTPGAQTPSPVKEDKTSLEALKAHNDEFEAQLIRGRELEAERQKLEANAMLGGTTGGHIEPVVVPQTAKEYADKVMKGEIKE